MFYAYGFQQCDDSQVRARVSASRLHYRLRKSRSGFLISDIQCYRASTSLQGNFRSFPARHSLKKG
jgi:hypothetical protein